jgi:hypothetical protein
LNRLIIKVIAYSPFVLDAKRNQRAWEERFRAYRRTRVATAEQPAAS